MYFRKLTMRALGAVALLCAVAVLEPVAAPAAKGNSRLALGKTAQHRGVGMRLQAGRMRLLDFNAVLQCHDGSELVVEEGGFLPIRVGRGGKFADVQYGHTDTVRLRGRVGKRVVRGRIRVKDRWGKTPCDSRWFKFTARFKR